MLSMSPAVSIIFQAPCLYDFSSGLGTALLHAYMFDSQTKIMCMITSPTMKTFLCCPGKLQHKIKTVCTLESKQDTPSTSLYLSVCRFSMPLTDVT